MSDAAASRGRPILVAAASAFAVAILGGLMTDIGPWYYSLRKPSWSPPDWLFAPAWTVIFALTATAGVLAWRAMPPMRTWARIVSLFAVNGVLNIAWSAIYFRLHRPDWSLVESGLLWLSILALIVVIAPYSRAAALLLAPYLVWVAFATFLNYEIVRLNGPFAGA